MVFSLQLLFQKCVGLKFIPWHIFQVGAIILDTVGHPKRHYISVQLNESSSDCVDYISISYNGSLDI